MIIIIHAVLLAESGGFRRAKGYRNRLYFADGWAVAYGCDCMAYIADFNHSFSADHRQPRCLCWFCTLPTQPCQLLHSHLSEYKKRGHIRYCSGCDYWGRCAVAPCWPFFELGAAVFLLSLAVLSVSLLLLSLRDDVFLNPKLQGQG